MYIYDRQFAGNTFGQTVPSSAPSNVPGMPFDPSLNYVFAPGVIEAVGKVLSTAVPATHLQALGSGVDPLNVERGLTIFLDPRGQLQAGQVKFGANPRKERTSGSTVAGGSIRYSVPVDFEPWSI